LGFIEKKSDKSYILKIYVKPNSRKQKIERDGNFLAISLKSKAERNKANKELIKLLQKKLNLSSNQILFLSGIYNEDKIIQLDFLHGINKEELIKSLSQETLDILYETYQEDFERFGYERIVAG